MNKPIAIIMGSKSDLPVMREAEKIIKQFGLKCKVQIISAHRTPQSMAQFGETAHEKYSLIIAGAGGAAHLPGMVASYTTLPVIGVPVNINRLNGLDSLLSIAQMPKGIPVATVAIDGAANAGLLALRILSINDKKLRANLAKYARSLKNKVHKMNRQIRS